MNIHNVTLSAVCTQKSQYPKDNLCQIAFAGRSNVGKSSLINKLLNRKALARVSSKPGKTATINFYNIDNKIYFVDLPGYGYAKVSKEEKKKWAPMIEGYLNSSKNLKYVVLLVDIRHKPTEDDIMMISYIKNVCKRAVVIATKSDKIKKSQKAEALELIAETLHLGSDDIIIPFSSVTSEGRDEFWDYIDKAML